MCFFRKYYQFRIGTHPGRYVTVEGDYTKSELKKFLKEHPEAIMMYPKEASP